MSAFVEVLKLDELPPGKGTTVTAEGRDVAVFNVDGQVYAIDDSCAHAGASLGGDALRVASSRAGPMG